jgi:hypothetical protein
MPPSPFTGQFLRKADIWGLVSLKLFGPWFYFPKGGFIGFFELYEYQTGSI